MTVRRRILIGLTGLVALSYVASASAVMISTSGDWTSVEQGNGPVANIAGLDTPNLTWGRPFPAGASTPQSGYTFEGVMPMEVDVDGSNFPLGVFTHDNFSIFFPSITGATLRVELNVMGAGTTEFTYFFEHDETRNRGTCNPPGATQCPDVVSIPDASESGIVIIDGEEFLFTTVGFSSDGGNTIVEEFITEEEQANTATLFARLEPRVVQMPAPAPLALLAMGLLAIGFAAIRPRR